MNRFSKFPLIIILTSFFVIVAILFSNLPTKVLADIDQDAINSAPPGLDISKYFTLPTNPIANGADNPFNKNSAVTKRNGTVLSLAHGAGSYGVAWSKKSADNYININQDQTISAWLYFGSGIGDSDLINGQGMAFVLQNDNRGENSIGAANEGLGVYGFDKSTTTAFLGSESEPVLPDPKYIASTAVQNSMAIEFDSQLNNVNSASNQIPIKIFSADTSFFSSRAGYTLNGYDTINTAGKNPIPSGYPANTRLGASGPWGHVAFTYPGKTSSYATVPLAAAISDTQQYKNFTDAFSLFHTGAEETDLIDGTDLSGKTIYWHHVTIKWHPSKDGGKTAQLEYFLNDKYPDGTLNNSPTKNYKYSHKKITVDPSVLNADNSGKVYWGFTGANSTSTDVYSKLAVFESIPAFVDVTQATELIDHTQNKVITDDSLDKTINHDDKLSITYKLNINTTASRQNWNNILADITLPKHIIYTPDSAGHIATIVYHNADMTKAKTEYINTLNGQELKATLSQALGNQSGALYTGVDISINGTATNTTTDSISVNPTPAVFTGTNQIVSTSTPNFTLNHQKAYSLILKTPVSDSNLIYQQSGADLKLPATLNYSDKQSFTDNNKISYNVKIGDHNYTATETDGLLSADKLTYTGSIPIRTLIDGDSSIKNFWDLFPENKTQKITVIAINQKSGLVSNAVDYNVNVLSDKSLKLTVSKNLSFATVHYLNNQKYIKRNGNFILKVSSQKEPWILTVITKGLLNSGQKFKGNLIYKDPHSSTYDDLSSTPTTIAEDDSDNEVLETTDISKDWDDNSGLLIKPTGQSAAGEYTGTLNWTVSDHIQS